MFDWVQKSPRPAREADVRPLFRQIVEAMQVRGDRGSGYSYVLFAKMGLCFFCSHHSTSKRADIVLLQHFFFHTCAVSSTD